MTETLTLIALTMLIATISVMVVVQVHDRYCRACRPTVESQPSSKPLRGDLWLWEQELRRKDHA